MAAGKIDNRGSITFANTTSIGGNFLSGDGAINGEATADGVRAGAAIPVPVRGE
jgi:hypothetical protein